jgi:hypothetical protein
MVPTTNAWRIEFDMMDTTTALGKMRATDGIKNRFTKISTNCNCCDNLEFSRFGGIERHGGTLDAHVVFFHNFVAQKMMSSYVVAMFHHQ